MILVVVANRIRLSMPLKSLKPCVVFTRGSFVPVGGHAKSNDCVLMIMIVVWTRGLVRTSRTFIVVHSAGATMRSEKLGLSRTAPLAYVLISRRRSVPDATRVTTWLVRLPPPRRERRTAARTMLRTAGRLVKETRRPGQAFSTKISSATGSSGAGKSGFRQAAGRWHFS